MATLAPPIPAISVVAVATNEAISSDFDSLSEESLTFHGPELQALSRRIRSFQLSAASRSSILNHSSRSEEYIDVDYVAVPLKNRRTLKVKVSYRGKLRPTRYEPDFE